jgi:Stigma-specific protein, Stig1
MRLLVAVLFLSACPKSTKTQCMSMNGKSELVSDAKLLRLDIYPATVMCVDGDVPPGSVPLLSHTFKPGEEVKLDVPPGNRTIVLVTFADEAGTILTGQGCTTAMLSPGGQVCINLTILPAPDLAVIADLSVVDNSMCSGSNCPCNNNPDNCPAGQWCDAQAMCQVGCKTSNDCVGVGPANDGGMARTACNTSLHQCVECLANSDCPLGKLCSPSGFCVIGCDSGHACPGGLACCNSLCVDTTTDPLNCGACGNPCNVGAATSCCASICTDVNTSVDHCGACGHGCSTDGVATRHCTTGQCTPTCSNGRGDCNPPSANDGCETDTTNPAHCGGCNTVCAPDVTTHAVSVDCNADGGFCAAWGCSTNFSDCDSTGTNTNGCETNTQNGDVNHCGGCLSSACDTTNSTPADCSSGVCVYSGCKNNHLDCTNSGDSRNLLGCETATNSTSHCGGCAACDSTQIISDTCALDAGTHCVYNCNPPFADCERTPPNTSGCTVNTSSDPDNCTGCGNTCSSNTAASRACNGTKCTYGACNSGRANCNSGGLDTNGCECPSAAFAYQGTVGGCCSSNMCQTQHDNGVAGGHYYDCIAKSTINQTQALKACQSNNNGTCVLFKCTDGSGNVYGDDVYCDNNGGSSTDCNCWAFPHSPPWPVPTPGPQASGHVNTSCFCPATSDPSWN